MADRIQYQKLPGHRRGFIRSCSLWLGPDHLLSVNSLRFREEYKRYYFRDIQAIVIVRRPRFHLSTRAAAIGYFWVVAFAALVRVPRGPMIVGAAGVGLVLTWLYVSGLCSCVCRIYTAVSQDRLPSVYRTWAARRFLQMLEPKIFAIQGTLEQPLDLETLRIGSAEAATSPALPSQPHSERRALSFHLLLTVLLANAIWSWLELRGMARHSPLLSDAFSMLEIAAAILTIVQHRRQKVSGAQQKLAIATLVGVGLFFYGTMISAAALAGAQAAAREAVNTTSIIHYSAQLDFIAALVLSLAGVAILFLDKPSKQEHGSIIS